jgi:hypothetical protein
MTTNVTILRIRRYINTALDGSEPDFPSSTKNPNLSSLFVHPFSDVTVSPPRDKFQASSC